MCVSIVIYQGGARRAPGLPQALLRAPAGPILVIYIYVLMLHYHNIIILYYIISLYDKMCVYT